MKASNKNMLDKQDEDIIKMVLQGNNNAYADLIERYQHFVFTLAIRFVRNEHDAEEIAQDVFIKAYRSLHQYNHNSKFGTWLYSICKNSCLSHLRKLGTEETLYSDIEEATHDEVIKGVEQRSKQQTLRKAIKELKNEDAVIITLFYINEQTTEEISQIMEISVSNVKVKLYRARKKLKSIIETKYKNELTE